MTKKENDVIEIDLTVLIKALWHRAYVIVLFALMFGGLSFYITAYKTVPIYRADALMYVNNSSLSFVGGKISISPGELDAAQSLVDTYAVITRSRTTLNEVINRAGLKYTYEQLNGMISTAAINGTEIFKISVDSPSPEEAEYIANTIADVLPETIAQIVDGSSVRVVDYAVVPKRKISPNITKSTILGMILGGVLASGIVVLLALFNDVIKGKEDLMQNYDEAILTVVPRIKNSSHIADKKRNSQKNKSKEEKI